VTQVLEAQGNTPLAPSDRQNLHPLVIPLCSGPLPTHAGESPDASVKGDSRVIGLLRWPDPKQHGTMQLPVVSMSRSALGVNLLARSVDELLHR